MSLKISFKGSEEDYVPRIYQGLDRHMS